MPTPKPPRAEQAADALAAALGPPVGQTSLGHRRGEVVMDPEIAERIVARLRELKIDRDAFLADLNALEKQNLRGRLDRLTEAAGEARDLLQSLAIDLPSGEADRLEAADDCAKATERLNAAIAASEGGVMPALNAYRVRFLRHDGAKHAVLTVLAPGHVEAKARAIDVLAERLDATWLLSYVAELGPATHADVLRALSEAPVAARAAIEEARCELSARAAA